MVITIATLRSQPHFGKFLASGVPNVKNAVASAQRYFGHVGADVDSSALKSEYERLASLGYNGRLYPAVGSDLDFERQLVLMDGVRPMRVDSLCRWDPYWMPGTEKRSITVAELNHPNGTAGFTARLALYSSNPGECDPLLHFRGLSFDDERRESGMATQLEMIERATDWFATAHSGCSLSAASHHDYPTWVTMDRLDEVDPLSVQFVLNRGLMRTAALGRRSVGGGSMVGYVCSDYGRAHFDRSTAEANDDYGVGLSVGFEA